MIPFVPTHPKGPSRSFSFFAVALLSGLFAWGAAPGRPPLVWGDPAPELAVSRWVKGAPVPALKTGNVYVVEFWATWCGPCKMAIPHLTELARTFAGRVTFIGVDIREKGDSEAAIDRKVDAFVQKMGARMDYHVCRDTREASMFRTWMLASGMQGIPHAFVVDAQGRIAWSGGPQDLRAPLEQILEGTYDIRAAAAKRKAHEARLEAERTALAASNAAAEAAVRADEQAQDAVLPGIEAAVRAKDWPLVLCLAERAEAEHPGLPTLGLLLKAFRVRALAHTDPGKAKALLEVGLKPATVEAYLEAIYVLMRAELSGKPWSGLGLGYLEKAMALDPQIKGESLTDVARFFFLLGTDEAQAKATLDAVRAKDDGSALVELADVLVSREGLSRPWLEAAVAILEPRMEDHPEEAGWLLAEAYARLGKAGQAVKTAEALLAALKEGQAPARELCKAEAALKTYRASGN